MRGKAMDRAKDALAVVGAVSLGVGMVWAAKELAEHLGKRGNDDEQAPPAPLAVPPAAIAAATPPGEKVRVYIDGCFDMMHYGHCNALRQARAAGTELVVGLNGDDDIVKHKGSSPVVPFAERLQMLQSCKFVDEVIPNAPYELTKEWVDMLVSEYDIRWIVHGDDPCITADGKDAYAYCKEIGNFKLIKRTEGVSTTDIVGRLLLQTREHHLHQLEDELPASGEPGRPHRPKSSSVSSLAMVEAVAGEEGSLASASVSGTPQGEPMASAAAAAGASPAGSTPGADSALNSNTAFAEFMPTTRRIVEFAERRAPKPGDRVVYICGAFDLFNSGHVAALKQAREFGDFLLVGVHSDDVVNKRRGHGFPILNLHERVLSVMACRHADEVVIGAPGVVTEDLLKTFNISVVVHGTVSQTGSPRPTAGDDEEADEEPTPLALMDMYEAPRRLHMLKQFESTSPVIADTIMLRVLAQRAAFVDRFRRKRAAELSYQEEKQFVEEL